MLEAGTKAPAFALPDQDGNVHTLEEYRGKKVILYFYPRDNTPGCTKQACGFGIIRRAAQNRHAASASCTRSFWRRERWCWG